MTIRIIAEDLETGERGEQVIQPGNYCIVVAKPCYVDHEQHYATGTTVLTLKGRSPHLMASEWVQPEAPVPGEPTYDEIAAEKRGSDQ